ncbi:molybdopterin molybdotransferase [Tistlia consotensis]|uniref:Molybdopterin molybdenumtransferase n=1 Tax=Tistlia consotensis USBA 355 TaxID=560819 RepID=A0A1Y6CF07_9PROT|nr:gephyrin-like molybdotransferase Glp [Tistlia consotensis]SMF60924.1 molybdopterin molybdotransferase [Tistlia consotensis USBA 355]SNR92442.1 molybdopterin molybdotransferase [Tistlia consotensis]
MAQLSDDCFAHGGKLMTVEEALALIEARTARVTGEETVALDAALGRVLAEDLVAAFSVPAHDNSAVDGYAVYFDDLDPEAETRLPIRGRAAAGHPLAGPQARGTAVRIFTGAAMPAGLDGEAPDTVMMQEDCRLEGDTVVIAPGIRRGSNRRLAGEDIRQGETVLAAGRRLRPQDLGQAAAIGRRELAVAGRLRVALFSTGDELREPGSPLPPGCIYDSNRHTLGGLLRGLGCAVTDLGILEDREPAVRAALAEAAGSHDLVITSGGVSVGEEDHVKAAVEALGRLHAWRLAIKPGRPIALGQVGRVPLVGLPGNPVAVVVTFVTFVRPLILRLAGAAPEPTPGFAVTAGFAHRKKRDRREWLRASLDSEDGRLVARKFPRDGAGILSSIVESDGLVELPEDLTRLEPGTTVRFLPFSALMS